MGEPDEHQVFFARLNKPNRLKVYTTQTRDIRQVRRIKVRDDTGKMLRISEIDCGEPIKANTASYSLTDNAELSEKLAEGCFNECSIGGDVVGSKFLATDDEDAFFTLFNIYVPPLREGERTYCRMRHYADQSSAAEMEIEEQGLNDAASDDSGHTAYSSEEEVHDENAVLKSLVENIIKESTREKLDKLIGRLVQKIQNKLLVRRIWNLGLTSALCTRIAKHDNIIESLMLFITLMGDNRTAEYMVCRSDIMKLFLNGMQSDGVHEIDAAHWCSTVFDTIKHRAGECNLDIATYMSIQYLGRCNGNIRLIDENESPSGSTFQHLSRTSGAIEKVARVLPHLHSQMKISTRTSRSAPAEHLRLCFSFLQQALHYSPENRALLFFYISKSDYLSYLNDISLTGPSSDISTKLQLEILLPLLSILVSYTGDRPDIQFFSAGDDTIIDTLLWVALSPDIIHGHRCCLALPCHLHSLASEVRVAALGLLANIAEIDPSIIFSATKERSMSSGFHHSNIQFIGKLTRSIETTLDCTFTSLLTNSLHIIILARLLSFRPDLTSFALREMKSSSFSPFINVLILLLKCLSIASSCSPSVGSQIFLETKNSVDEIIPMLESIQNIPLKGASNESECMRMVNKDIT